MPGFPSVTAGLAAVGVATEQIEANWMIFLHVGTHKTGTTFMQKRVFPKFTGIQYIHPSSPIDTIFRLKDDRTYLLSNERLAGRLWADRDEIERSLEKLSIFFPDSRVLISFRPHHEYVISSYKQYLHEGGALPFEKFFDVEGDRGFFKKDQLEYRFRIEAIERFFGAKPFVFLLEEIEKACLPGLLAEMAAYLGATAPDAEEIEWRITNRGVNRYQADVLRVLNRMNRSKLNPDGRLKLDNRLTRMFKVDPRRFSQYWLAFLPNKNDFMREQERTRITELYREDWNFVLQTMRKRTALASG